MPDLNNEKQVDRVERRKRSINRIEKLRYAMLACLSTKEMLHVYAALIDKAKEGNVPAIRLVFEYTIGKAIDIDLQTRMQDMEDQIGQLEKLLELKEAAELGNDPMKIAE